MRKPTVLLVLFIAFVLIAGGIASRGRGGVISRWIAAHQSNAGH